jgi:uncharacterized cupredoxin-like copper-binding protein
MRRAIVLVCVLAALGAGGVALASRESASVGVTEKEFKVTPAVTSVKAGKVTFSVKNVGHVSHEFIVDKTAASASKLKTKGPVAVITGLQGKIAPFKPGQTKTLTLTLKPGHYVLLCNLPAHYQAGQRIDFTVR